MASAGLLPGDDSSEISASSEDGVIDIVVAHHPKGKVKAWDEAVEMEMGEDAGGLQISSRYVIRRQTSVQSTLQDYFMTVTVDTTFSRKP